MVLFELLLDQNYFLKRITFLLQISFRKQNTFLQMISEDIDDDENITVLRSTS